MTENNGMPNMSIENIAKACNGKYYGEKEKLHEVITGAVTDSRQVGLGFLFIPIKGARVDGHDFIEDVFQKGALVVLSEKELSNPGGPYIRVESSEEAMKKIAAFYREQLSVKVVGIIGSVGKTSTKEMVASVLAQKYRVLKTEGNFNNEIGLPLTIFKIRAWHEAAVLEMGISDFGEMHRLAAMAQPDISVITNIGLCHLEKLGTRDGILKAKTEVFEHMRPDGTVILNADDDKLAALTVVNGKPPVFYGLDTACSYVEKGIYASDVKNCGLDGMQAKIHTPQGSFSVQIPIAGEHNVYNALAAAAAGLEFGLTLEEISQGIAAAETIAGRANVIHTAGFTLIDDCYNANPVSMKASIDVLAHTKGRRIAVLGDMGELGEEEKALHRQVGTAVKSAGIDTLFAAGRLAEEYVHAAGDACETHYFKTVEEMIPQLTAYVEENDVILVKASHFMEFPKVVEALKEKGRIA